MGYFFEQQGNRFIAGHEARSPWDAKAMNGVLVAGLFGHLFEQQVDFSKMNPGRFTVDIDKPVPHIVDTQVKILREGKRIRVLEARLFLGDEVFARATLSCVRQADLEAFSSAGTSWPTYPAPYEVTEAELTPDYVIAPTAHINHVVNPVETPGHGVVWMNFHYDLLKNQPISSFVQSCMMADMGHGTARALDFNHWLYINIDINMIYYRQPVGDWILVDARMDGDGVGQGMSYSLFADEKGVFGRGLQTLFIERR